MIRVNAVLAKELTTRMRGWRAATIITIYLAVLSVVSLLVLSTSPTPTSYSDSAKIGGAMFAWLAGLEMALIIFVTPASTADAISGERQRQTLELLLVTRLSSLSIVLGKLVAGLAFDVLLILCSLPLFSLVFLFGGVSPDQFVSTFVIFLGTTLVLGSMSLFISTIIRRSGAAIVVALLCTLGLTVGLVLVTLYLAFVGGSATGGAGVAMPFTAYLDPLIGFTSTFPSFLGIGGHYFTGGALNLSFWEDQVVVDVILSALFIAGSVYLLRPRVRRMVQTPTPVAPPTQTHNTGTGDAA